MTNVVINDKAREELVSKVNQSISLAKQFGSVFDGTIQQDNNVRCCCICGATDGNPKDGHPLELYMCDSCIIRAANSDDCGGDH